MNKLYTRRGDDGSTGLGSRQRVDKAGLRIEAIGSVDELNSLIGVVRSQGTSSPIGDLLLQIQRQLFDLGALLAQAGQPGLDEAAVTELERHIDRLDETLPPLKAFILPGGSGAAASCHLARSVCRRAERRVVELAHQEPVEPVILQYLNRLSDLLFVVARTLSKEAGGDEVRWHE